MEYAADRQFNIGEAIGAGWRRLWPNIGPMLAFAVIVWVVQFLLNLIQPEGFVANLVITVVGFVISSLISIGWIKIALDITDGRPVTKDAVTERFSLIGPYLVAAIVYVLAVMLGLVALIVPGIIIAIMWAFYGFHIVDTGERDAMGALRRSAELTKGQRGRLFGFGIVLFFLNVLGFLLLVVGVIITSAISLLAAAHVYRTLTGPVADPAVPPVDPGWSTP